ncbi:MAG: acyltransferase [Sphingobacteriaceae bacterium]|nr:acyltransferase [Sphingobacteriaceae bacterium]
MKHHIKSLDSLRGLAAISVFFQHVSLIQKYDGVNYFRPWYFYMAASEAVILFFVLSGFVLTLSFEHYGLKSYKEYVIRRVFRLYPAYYISIILGIVAFLIISPMKIEGYSEWFNSQFSTIKLTKNLIFNSAILVSKDGGNLINAVVWSLKYEAIISILILPMIWKFYNHLGKFIITFVIFIILLTLYIKMHHQSGGIMFIYRCVYYSTFFIIGIIICKYKSELKRFSHEIFLPIYLFFYASMFFSCGHFFLNEIARELSAAIGGSGLIIVCMHNKKVNKILSFKIINFYGQISYSFYLLHMSILYILVYTLRNYIELSYIKLLMFILTSILSFIVYKTIEMPFMKIAKHISRTHSST